MILAELQTLRAKVLLAIILLFPLVIGFYLIFFRHHAMKNLRAFEIVPPGKSPLLDNINRSFYLVMGFVLLFVGLKLIPLLIEIFRGSE